MAKSYLVDVTLGIATKLLGSETCRAVRESFNPSASKMIKWSERRLRLTGSAVWATSDGHPGCQLAVRHHNVRASIPAALHLLL
ncbi:MAG: hypothetical protein R3D57_02680 [Hyphomicrobiaceae bacterium]